MGTANISAVGKLLVQDQNVTAGIGIQDEDSGISFMDVISQMSASVGDTWISQSQTMDAGNHQKSQQLSATDSYERQQYRKTEVAERSVNTNRMDDQTKERLDTYADDVKEVLKEELGVTDEQIEEAMENLGLAFADLANPNQLASLVGELTGCQDAGELLCNDSFLTVMQEVGELTENLLKELGVSAEEFSQMLNEVQNLPDTTQTLDTLDAGETLDTPRTLETPDVGKSMEASDTASDPELPVMESDDESQGTMVVQQDAQAESRSETMADALKTEVLSESGQEGSKVPTKETTSLEDTPSDTDISEDGSVKVETELSSGKSSDASGREHSSENGQSQNGTGETAMFSQNVSEAVYTQTAENVSEFSKHMDVENIIRQIVEAARVTISDASTTLEMQLEPENLGKIYLEISSKQGNVSAHIMAQNEVVKEALETQVAELRQNLEQAGVRVDSVEVTVGSHEFEKNLEQDARREEDQTADQEKAAKQTRRVNLNLNELDELNGIMTEEESLVAQMMADQGNSIDFMA